MHRALLASKVSSVCARARSFYAALLSSGSILLLLIPMGSLAEPIVVGYELVSSTRVDRIRFDYTYRVRVANTQPSFSRVVLRASSTAATTNIVEGDVYLGVIGANSTVLSDDTITLRQERTAAFNPAVIQWSVSGKQLVVPTGAAELLDVRFVEYGGRPEHEGWLPIDNQPVFDGGTHSTVLVHLDRPIGSPELRWVDSAGVVLGTSPLEPLGETGAIPADYIGSVGVPDVPFRLQVRGTDDAGHELIRTWDAPFSPSSAKLSIVGFQRSATPGGNVNLLLRLTNLSSAQVFDVTLAAQGAPSIVLSPMATAVSLAARETRDIPITIGVPGSAAPYTAIALQATVLGRNDARATNTASADLEVAAP